MTGLFLLLTTAATLGGDTDTQDPTYELLKQVEYAKLTPLQSFKALFVLPNHARWPSGYDAYGKYRVVEFPESESGTTLTVSLKNGTWEQPKGNSPMRPLSQELEGVWLQGSGQPLFSIPIKAKRRTMLQPPIGMSSLGARVPWGEVATWGDNLYAFSSEKGWFFGKFAGRAPFDLSPEDVGRVESVLHRVRKHLETRGSKADLVSLFRGTYGQHRQGDAYRIEPATFKVQKKHISVSLDVPVHLPSFFKEDDFIMTSFAHDAGQIVQAMDLGGLKFYPGSYFFGPLQSSRREDQMGEARRARFYSFSLYIPD